MKLVYPACFYPEENGQYSVVFPDLNEAATFGDSLEQAIEMAIDLASGWLMDSIQENEQIPKPSNIKDVLIDEEDAFVSLIAVDLTEYERLHGNKAVKKTLTIPMWMNTLAEKEGINFSAVLQNALKEQLHLNQ
ncbi:type II toxin-antitoxin system HicB family antitoxin [Zhenhengia yiwuensis]|uniref:Type II toxin-antitoxin system HicB family antitoxin n=1 Tax=Zhenhengia yiwuensis TaxID=2763666 RepID=A0A926EI78_9FIRM|nr:type II toxin-antitoxin system HicB family antitoxin [Zhenhengia yiwuensis]MBC8581666.1 type II toxin-antitoxin system HicB family antitoxin [Zhenhengia yiwuensis]